MILNVSGRTDIVAFYTPWFMRRYHEGYVDVRNPFYPKLIQRIYFDQVDAIVFCTKNPLPILSYLKEITKPILFQITLTAYQREIEPMVPKKREIVKAIKKISKEIGIEQVYWRYDPIFLSEKYTIDYHLKSFSILCELLQGSIKHIIVSFIDDYKNVRKNGSILKNHEITEEEMVKLGIRMVDIASTYGMTIQTCAEEHNLTEVGFIKEDCVSATKIFQLTGKTNFKRWKGRGNKHCHCIEMVDVGAYNSCGHFCKYCYANYDEKKVQQQRIQHDPTSSILIGHLKEEDQIQERRS